jgi:hypothetical protein
VAKHLDACDLSAKRPGDSTQRNARRGLTSASALENRSRIGESVLLHSCEVGMTWPGTAQRGISRQRVEFGLIDRIWRHDLFPLGPFAITDLDRHRTTKGETVSNATEDPNLVALKLHAGTSTCTESTSSQIQADFRGGDFNAGRKPFGNCHQGRTVRLACC